MVFGDGRGGRSRSTATSAQSGRIPTHEPERRRRLSLPAARAAPPASSRPSRRPDPSPRSPSSDTSQYPVLACKNRPRIAGRYRRCTACRGALSRNSRGGSAEEAAGVEASRVLFEGRVDAEGRGEHDAVQRLRQWLVGLDDVVVGLGEHRLREGFPGLCDPGDLVAGLVLDVPVPGAPVLTVQHADLLTVGLQCEPDLADYVLLDDLADLLTVPALDHDAGLHELAWPCQGEHHLAAGVHDLEL